MKCREPDFKETFPSFILQHCLPAVQEFSFSPTKQLAQELAVAFDGQAV